MRQKTDFQEREFEYAKSAFEEVRTIYYFWLVKSMYTTSQKSSKLMWEVCLMLEKFGTSRSGIDLLHKFGETMTGDTYRKKTERALQAYDADLELMVISGIIIWIDNFAKFLKHFLLNMVTGSATSNQMTAVAYRRSSFALGVLVQADRAPILSWPKTPCGENAERSIKAKLLEVWIQCQNAQFDLGTVFGFPSILQVPMRLPVCKSWDFNLSKGGNSTKCLGK